MVDCVPEREERCVLGVIKEGILKECGTVFEDRVLRVLNFLNFGRGCW